MEKSVLVINIGQGSRINLGRPSISPQENKKLLMNFLRTNSVKDINDESFYF